MNFDRDHAFEYATPEQIAPGLTRVTARNPSAMTFHGTGTYVLGEPFGAMIDPGPRLDEHRDVLTGMLGDTRPSHLLVTHRHQDHAGLARSLADALDLPVSARGAGEVADEGLGSETPAPDYQVDIALADGAVIEGADFRLEVVHTPGHTSDHLCFIEPDRKWVFCGDHVMAWSTSVIVPPDGHVGRYLESLERLLAFEDHVFWPTHGPPIRDPGRWIRELVEHRHERERQLLEELAAGPASAGQLVGRIYGDIDPRLVRAARASLLAGVAWAREKGLVIVDDEGEEATIRRA